MIGPPLQIGITHVPAALLIATPVAVAMMGTSVLVIALWFAFVLSLHMFFNVKGLWEPEGYILETLAVSPFAEYVRWSMDILQVDYKEVDNVGILGLLLFGRTVPMLHIPKYKSSIGNSRDIVRYLYGKHLLEGRAAFLQPLSGKAAELEPMFEKLGGFSRLWTYYYMFCDNSRSASETRSILLRAWGVHQSGVQLLQRLALRLLYPVFQVAVTRFLRINASCYRKAFVEIEKTLETVDALLADGRTYLLSTPEKTHLDMYFACMAALVIRPPEYGGGKIEPASRIKLEEMPLTQREQIEKWRGRPSGQFVLRMFAKERGLCK